MRLNLRSGPCLAFFLAFGCCCSLQGLKAADPVELSTQGIEFLRDGDLASAEERFEAALEIAPEHDEAVIGHALVRIGRLVEDEEVVRVLSRFGLSISRDGWSAFEVNEQVDADGNLIIAEDLTGGEVVAVLRNSILSQLSEAEQALAAIPDGFEKVYPAERTGLEDDFTLDGGDVHLLRAALQFVKFVIQTVTAENWEVQAAAVRQLAEGETDLEQFLLEHPDFLTRADSSSAAEAKGSLEEALELYLHASSLIRSRTLFKPRLFNIDPEFFVEEREFRVTAEEILLSLEEPVVLSAAPEITLHAGALFEGDYQWRSILPQVSGNGFSPGTLPDETFGGAVQGLERDVLESHLAEIGPEREELEFVSIEIGAGGLELTVFGPGGESVLLERSEDLRNWEGLRLELLGNEPMTWTDQEGLSLRRAYYRVSAASGPANDDFANRALLEGGKVTVNGVLGNASEEVGEPAHAGGGSERTIWWEWVAPKSGMVMVEALEGIVEVFSGSELESLSRVDPVLGWDDAFEVEAGVRYAIRVSSGFWWDWEVELRVQLYELPENDGMGQAVVIKTGETVKGHSVGATQAGDEPLAAVWWKWQAPETGEYAIDVLDLEESGVTEPEPIHLYQGGVQLDGAVLVAAPPPLEGRVLFEAEAGVDYLIGLSEGATAAFRVREAVRPMNDAMAEAHLLQGVEITVIGSNEFGTREAGEPPGTGEHTIWWRWEAPATGRAVYSIHGSSLEYSKATVFEQAASSMEEVSATWWTGDWEAEQGVIYLIAVGTQEGTPGGDVTLSVRLFESPMNDDFTGSFEVPSLPFTGNSHLLGVTQDAAAPFGIGWSLWWSWTADSSGPVGIEAGWPDWPARVAVFSGDTVEELEPVAASPGNPATGWLFFTPTAGATYHFLVGYEWFFGALDPLTVRIRHVEPAEIEAFPPPAGLVAGDTVEFTDSEGTLGTVTFNTFDAASGTGSYTIAIAGEEDETGILTYTVDGELATLALLADGEATPSIIELRFYSADSATYTEEGTGITGSVTGFQRPDSGGDDGNGEGTAPAELVGKSIQLIADGGGVELLTFTVAEFQSDFAPGAMGTYTYNPAFGGADEAELIAHFTAPEITAGDIYEIDLTFITASEGHFEILMILGNGELELFSSGTFTVVGEDGGAGGGHAPASAAAFIGQEGVFTFTSGENAGAVSVVGFNAGSTYDMPFFGLSDSFNYVKTGDDTGTVTFQTSTTPVDYQLTFNGPNTGTFTEIHGQTEVAAGNFDLAAQFGGDDHGDDGGGDGNGNGDAVVCC